MRIVLVVCLTLIMSAPAFVFARVPNDPQVQQWAYKDTNVYQAWDTATGSETVVVAVIDNGFDNLHPDLKKNVWTNKKEIADNNKDDDKNGYVDDVYGWNFISALSEGGVWVGNNDPRPDVSKANKQTIVIHHGTAVAGIIGAIGNNTTGGAGLNWKVKLMNIKVVDETGVTTNPPLAEAIRYAVDNGAHVINMSVASSVDISAMDDSGKSSLVASIEYAYKKGVAVFAGAGNATIGSAVNLNQKPYFPVCADRGQAVDWVFGVSAIGEDHRLAWFSNYGSDCVDITAPGVNLGSTLFLDAEKGYSEVFGSGWNGTSFATPMVAGTAALIKSINPEWGPTEIYAALVKTVHKTPTTDEAEYTNLFGAGLLQVDKAVAYAQENSPRREAFISSIMSFNPLTGQIREWRYGKTGVAAYERVALTGIDDVAAYTDADGAVTLAIVTFDKKNTGTVTILNKKWFTQSSFSVDSPGPQQIILADITQDKTPEVILSPQYTASVIARVYTLSGQLLDTHSLSGKHAGVSVTLIRGTDSTKDRYAALYKSEKGMVITRYEDLGQVQHETAVNYLDARGNLAAGDIDGDEAPEYVVAAGAGEEPDVIYYELDGKMKRKFLAYDGSYLGGLDVAVGDFNHDNTEDVILAPLAGLWPVRVYDKGSNKLSEWWPFGEKSPTPVRLFLTY